MYKCYKTNGILKTLPLTLLHSERPKLYTILAFLSAIGLRVPLLIREGKMKMFVTVASPEVVPCDLKAVTVIFLPLYLKKLLVSCFLDSS